MAATLLERLTQIGLDRNIDPVIPIHQMHGFIGEWERGKVTLAQIVAAFSLTAAQEAELVTLLGKIVTPAECIPLGGRVTLTNVGTAYIPLAIARIECAGITAFQMDVGCNRNGSGGTVSWQLFDETNTQEVTVIDDTAGAGDKILSTLKTFASPLAKGERRLVLRAKSTTTTDDPIHAGSSLLIRRVERFTADEFHQLLLLSGIAPYDTIAAFQTRLGV